MDRDRGARHGTSSGSAGKARDGQFTGDTHLSLLSAENAGQTGLNRITHAESSTSTWYAFAGQVNNRRSLFMIGGKSGCRPNRMVGKLPLGTATIRIREIRVTKASKGSVGPHLLSPIVVDCP